MQPVITNRPFYSQQLVKCLQNSGKNIAHKLSVILHIKHNQLQGNAFSKSIFRGKKSGTPLELLITEMILKVKMVFYEKDTNNNCRN